MEDGVESAGQLVALAWVVVLVGFAYGFPTPEVPSDGWYGSLREAVALLDTRRPEFEYEGEMSPEVALNHEMQRRYYPFSRLSGPANILIMPGLQSASLSAKLLRALGGENVLGPFLVGMKLPVQIAPMTASATDLVTLAVLASGGVEGARGR